MCGGGEEGDVASSSFQSSGFLVKEIRSSPESLEREGEFEVCGGRRRCDVVIPQKQEVTRAANWG